MTSSFDLDGLPPYLEDLGPNLRPLGVTNGLRGGLWQLSTGTKGGPDVIEGVHEVEYVTL